MKKIDSYIFRNFLGTFFYSISLIIIIVIVFDISEKLEDFIQKQAPLKAIVFDYYVNFIPYFVNLFSPLFTFIAVIFFTSKMAYRTEIVAILSSGISFRRMLFPYFLGALIITLLSLGLNNFIIPHANKNRLEFEEAYVRNPFRNRDQNIHIQTEPGVLCYMEAYNNEDNVGYKFSLEKIKDSRIQVKLLAESIKWDSVQGKWKLNTYFIREIKGMKENIRSGFEMDTLIKNLHPKDFGRKTNAVEVMNLSELNDYIRDEKLKGASNIETYEIEKQKRIAFPFATFILTLIGVSIASRKVRGGIGLHIGIGLLISFAFILFMQVSTTFAMRGIVAPVVAVWIPNILFGILGALLLKYAPK